MGWCGGFTQDIYCFTYGDLLTTNAKANYSNRAIYVTMTLKILQAAWSIRTDNSKGHCMSSL